ncbi:MAG: hypothetical protein ACK5JR_06825 [Tropicimonas sp.]|uniref:hypothetical protein n=1 Tax=Tropicimonas sp. TaxID=2067044 RepID=UPI003A8A8205
MRRRDIARPALVAGCLWLAACAETGGQRAMPSAPAADPVFVAGGIQAGATGREIGFGRTEAGAIAAMSKLMGRAPERVTSACPGLRAATWADGTALYFEERRWDPPAFTGWQRDGNSAGRTCAS